jgi:hypothetical protein
MTRVRIAGVVLLLLLGAGLLVRITNRAKNAGTDEKCGDRRTKNAGKMRGQTGRSPIFHKLCHGSEPHRLTIRGGFLRSGREIGDRRVECTPKLRQR